jgi:polysaccharide pyruvyl transferase WcaK-like protein
MILGREDMIVCVRNDGSTRALHELLPDLKVGQIPVMPDGGFFAGRSLGILSVNQSAHTRVGINLAGDMLERRFSKGNSYEKFLKGMAEMSVGLLDMRENLEIEFVPHIWRDVVFLSELLPLIPDPYLRRRIAIASLKPTARGLDAFLRTYSEFDLVLGMRFHANVCPIGMGVPTRGLVNYPQIKLLYEELTMSDRAFDELSFEDSQKLQRLVVSDLENIHAIRAHFIHKMDLLNKMAGETLSKVNAWLLKRFE